MPCVDPLQAVRSDQRDGNFMQYEIAYAARGAHRNQQLVTAVSWQLSPDPRADADLRERRSPSARERDATWVRSTFGFAVRESKRQSLEYKRHEQT